MIRIQIKPFLAAIFLLALLPLAVYSQTCKTFTTCADAVKSLQSGNTKIDGDGDGIPCEKLCGKNGENMPSGSPTKGKAR